MAIPGLICLQGKQGRNIENTIYVFRETNVREQKRNIWTEMPPRKQTLGNINYGYCGTEKEKRE